jgi:TP901 family phage tail tape measure protein
MVARQTSLTIKVNSGDLGRASREMRGLVNGMRQARDAKGRFVSHRAGLSTGQFDPGRGMYGRGGPTSGSRMRASYHWEQAGQQLQRVGQGARVGLQATVGLAADFEDQLSRVGALTTRGLGLVEAQAVVKRLEGEARRLGATTRYTATEAAEGLEFLAMAGYDADKQIKTIPLVLSLATIGHVEVARAAEIATNVLGGFGLAADQSARVADRMSAALVSGSVDMNDLAYTMSYMAPVAKAAGMSLETALGWADVLGDAGIKGSKAGTGGREIIARMAAPDDAAGKLLSEYGIKTKDDKGNLRDMTQVLGEIGVAWSRSGKGTADITAEATDLFGKIHRGSALVLIGAAAKGVAASTDDLTELQKVIGSEATLNEDQRKKLWEESLQSRIGRVTESEGLATEMSKKIEATTKGTWREVSSALEEVGISLGEKVLPMVVDFLKAVKPMIDDIAKWAKQNPEAIKAMAKIAFATVALSAVAVPLSTLLSFLSAAGGIGKAAMTGNLLGGAPGGGMLAGGGGMASGGAAMAASGMRMEFGDGPDAMWMDSQTAGRSKARTRRANRGSMFRTQRMTPAYADYVARQQQERMQQRAERRQANAAARQDRRFQRSAARQQRNAAFANSGVMNKASVAMIGFAIGVAIGEGINSGVKSLTGKTATEHLDDFMVDTFGDLSDPTGRHTVTSQRGGAKFSSELSREQERIRNEHLAMGKSLEEANAAVDEYTANMRAAGKLPPELEKHERERKIAAELGVTSRQSVACGSRASTSRPSQHVRVSTAGKRRIAPSLPSFRQTSGPKTPLFWPRKPPTRSFEKRRRPSGWKRTKPARTTWSRMRWPAFADRRHSSEPWATPRGRTNSPSSPMPWRMGCSGPCCRANSGSTSRGKTWT